MKFMTKEAADAAEKLAGWRDTARNLTLAGAMTGGIGGFGGLSAHLVDAQHAGNVAMQRGAHTWADNAHTRRVNEALRDRAQQAYTHKLDSLAPRAQHAMDSEKSFQHLRDALPPELEAGSVIEFLQGPGRGTPVPRRNISPETRAANQHLSDLRAAGRPIPMLSMGTPYPRR